MANRTPSKDMINRLRHWRNTAKNVNRATQLALQFFMTTVARAVYYFQKYEQLRATGQLQGTTPKDVDSYFTRQDTFGEYFEYGLWPDIAEEGRLNGSPYR
ncbi:hypothetical protein Pmar_PMAR022922 [Perkinsus marinus ATCC 50983]|uniref:Uncharacterized protein n=1 Tax=Perkinsus marinus (strain ATCC 50983 / TXsc) TaxID=423536 RepID=C5KN17_PERM5|nr:hypothetical protein Pmar_PMAR022922 [Perkinsus marinus ATCC 50983]EER14131.1 hypothetical protein Pmar_PMAR022922 [Perkinsus marinus ATCC 50983]|eukprot:XP_002782336.1 hypothetical protein Pmar_PMAR022922 [Perkinsus marinus ATCC 50983]